MSGQNNSQHE